MYQYRLLVINPGSTSTKISVFEDDENVFTDSVFHDSSVLLQFPTMNDQVPFRKKVITEMLEKAGYPLDTMDVFIGRGGPCYSVEGGVYLIDQKLYEDTRDTVGGVEHASQFGVQLAYILGNEYGKSSYMLDPIVTDEFCDLARVTGIKGVYRRSSLHALNQRATAMKHAKNMGGKYSDYNFVVCHIDGGITVYAHEKGRMIDGNDGAGGDGPFTPTRIGSIGVNDIVEYLKTHTPEDVRMLTSRSGGFVSHFGTSDSSRVHKMMEDGDPHATLVWEAMKYQIVRYIGAMAAVMGGKVDGIILTGGLVRYPDVAETIREKCGWIAEVSCYPGEFEQEALARSVLRVLRGEEALKHYSGKPVWDGFPFIKED